jgi:hypothetical protein
MDQDLVLKAESLSVGQEIFAFYGPRRVTTEFTRDHHWAGSRNRENQPIHSHPIACGRI